MAMADVATSLCCLVKDIRDAPGMEHKRIKAHESCHLSPALPLFFEGTGSSYFMLLFFCFPTL